MNLELQYLFLLLVSPGFAFLIHLIVARFFSLCRIHLNPLLIAGCSVLAGFFLISFAAWHLALKGMSEPNRFWASVYGVFVYGGLSFSYFQLFTMTETARRIRILRELRFEGKMRRSDLHLRYDAADMLAVRLRRLEEWGQLKCSDSRYVLTSPFLYGIAKALDWWAGVLGFKKGH